MELYIARHGQTEYNAARRLQGSGRDAPLTQQGIAQAKALGEVLADLSFDAVYVSPLKRAADTAAIALGDRYEPIFDERLVEIGFGVLEGMTYEAAAEAYPQSALEIMLSDPASYVAPPKGEALPDMLKRIGAFMDDVAQTEHQKVFVLAHGYVLKVFYACTVDKSIAAVGNAPRYGNCEAARYRYEQGKWMYLGGL